MSRSTNALGLLFVVLGLVVALAASAVMILSRSFNFAGAIIVGIGVLSSVFGALFIEPAPAKTALQDLAGIAGPYLPTIGKRRDDPPSGPIG